jgi:outer membrane receptor for ferrienterochelin and colicins
MRRHADAVLLALALAMGGGEARADDLSDLEGMLSETVVTTASKSAETSTAAPATSTTITAEDLRRYGIHSLGEAIDFLSLGVVTANPLGAVDIGARGVMLPRDFGDHFLLLINGHAVNDPLIGTARFDRGLGVPMEAIDHIEVILGPGSVLYGSNAMLGVINVITKRAKDWHGVHVAAEGEVSQSYDPAGPLASPSSRWTPTGYRGMAGAGYEFKLFGAPSEATLALELQQQDGPNFKFGPQFGGNDFLSGLPYKYNRFGPQDGLWGGVANDTYNSTVPGGQLRIVSGNFELNVHASTYRRSTPYRSRFTLSYADFGYPGYELDRSVWADLRHRVTLTPVVQLTTRVYADSFDYQDVQDTSQVDICRFGPETCSLHYYGEARWAGAEFQTSLDWLKNAKLVTLLGVDGRLRMGRSKTDFDDFATGRHVASSVGVIREDDKTLGAYLQQTWQVTPWLALNGGARFDVENRYPSGQASPRLAATINAWKGGTLKAIYAEAFRAPNWMETDYSNPSQIAGGPLAPERVRSVEGSIGQSFGTQKVLFGVFRSWWSNMVELHLLTPAEQAAAAASGLINEFTGSEFTQWRNVSSIDNYGFNASYGGMTRDGALRYTLNVTGAYARKSDPVQGSLPLTVTPQFFGNGRISYDIPGAWPTLGVAATFMGKRLADRAFDGTFAPTPSASAQLELRGTISGNVSFIPGLSYRLTADYAFASRGPYAVGPGNAGPPSAAELVPIKQYGFGAGLQYDFLK